MIIAAGAIFLSKNTKRVLLNFRSQHVKKGSTFGFWGGKIHDDEKILEGLSRELREEMGFIPDYEKIIPMDVFTSDDNKFRYYSYVIIVDDEFIPNINEESDGYLWCNIQKFPKQLHMGANIILENSSFKNNLLKLVS